MHSVAALFFGWRDHRCILATVAMAECSPPPRRRPSSTEALSLTFSAPPNDRWLFWNGNYCALVTAVVVVVSVLFFFIVVVVVVVVVVVTLLTVLVLTVFVIVAVPVVHRRPSTAIYSLLFRVALKPLPYAPPAICTTPHMHHTSDAPAAAAIPSLSFCLLPGDMSVTV